MFYLTPSPENAKAAQQFAANILSVTRQLRYSKDETKLALDLCIFINGLPVATFELKNLLTKQTVEDAVQHPGARAQQAIEPHLTLRKALEQWPEIERRLAESNRKRKLQNLSLS